MNKLMKVVLISAMGLFIAACTGVAKSSAEEAEKYQNTLVRAKQGDTNAMYLLAQYHFSRDEYLEAKKWFQLGADKGEARCLYNLGHIYYEGLGVKKDVNQAEKLWLKAANLDFTWAQHNLGAMYLENEEKQDIEQAIKWFSKAADKGDMRSQYILGVIYVTEENGSAERKAKAEKYLANACQKNYERSCELYKKLKQ